MSRQGVLHRAMRSTGRNAGDVQLRSRDLHRHFVQSKVMHGPAQDQKSPILCAPTNTFTIRSAMTGSSVATDTYVVSKARISTSASPRSDASSSSVQTPPGLNVGLRHRDGTHINTPLSNCATAWAAETKATVSPNSSGVGRRAATSGGPITCTSETYHVTSGDTCPMATATAAICFPSHAVVAFSNTSLPSRNTQAGVIKSLRYVAAPKTRACRHDQYVPAGNVFIRFPIARSPAGLDQPVPVPGSVRTELLGMAAHGHSRLSTSHSRSSRDALPCAVLQVESSAISRQLVRRFSPSRSCDEVDSSFHANTDHCRVE